MELFTPELGLVFWMFVTFALLLTLLARFAWPVIIKKLDERADFIDKGVAYVENAKKLLDNAKREAACRIEEAQKEQAEILRDANNMRIHIVEEAKATAAVEAKKVMDAANVAIEQAQKASEKRLRQEMGVLALEIAERVMRQELTDTDAQARLVDKLLNEVDCKNSQTNECL